MNPIFKLLLIIVFLQLNFHNVLAQGDKINLDTTISYSPTFFSSYSLKDRHSDPFSSLFSNNPLNFNTSLLKINSSYDTSRVFYVTEKIGNLDYRPSISIPFDSYDILSTKRNIKEYFRKKSLSLDGENTLGVEALSKRFDILGTFDLTGKTDYTITISRIGTNSSSGQCIPGKQYKYQACLS